MKKFIATALTMLTVFSCSAVAFAANETVLTTTVPDATYTLNIPADQEIPFGATSTDIGKITVTDSSGFAEGKDLNVTITYDDFKCVDVDTTIPFKVRVYATSTGTYLNSGDSLTFLGQEDGTVHEGWCEDATQLEAEKFYIMMNSEDWGKALAGDYSSTITFTAEVVSSQS